MSLCYLCKTFESSWPFIKGTILPQNQDIGQEQNIQIHLLCQIFIPNIELIQNQQQIVANIPCEQQINNEVDPCLICNDLFSQDQKGCKISCAMKLCKQSIHLGCLSLNNQMYLKRNNNKCILVCKQHIDQFDQQENISFEQLVQEVEQFIAYSMSFKDINHINVLFNDDKPKDGLDQIQVNNIRKRGRPLKSKQIFNQSVKDMITNFLGEPKNSEKCRIKQTRIRKLDEKYDSLLRSYQDQCDSYQMEYSENEQDNKQLVFESDYPNIYEDRSNLMKKWWDKINDEYFGYPDQKVLQLFQFKDKNITLSECLNYKEGEKLSRQKLEINIYAHEGIKALKSTYLDNEMLHFKVKKFISVLYECKEDEYDQKYNSQSNQEFIIEENKEKQQQDDDDEQKNKLNNNNNSQLQQDQINDQEQKIQIKNQIQKQIDNKQGFLAIYSYNDQAEYKASENAKSALIKQKYNYYSCKDIKGLCEYKLLPYQENLEKQQQLMINEDFEEDNNNNLQQQNDMTDDNQSNNDLLNMDKLQDNANYLSNQDSKLKLQALIYLDKSQYQNAIDGQITMLAIQNVINKRKQENRSIKQYLSTNEDSYSLDELAYNIIYLKHILHKKKQLTIQSKLMNRKYKENKKLMDNELQVRSYIDQHQKHIDILQFLCVIRNMRNGFQDKEEFDTYTYFKNLERYIFKRSQMRSQLTMSSNLNNCSMKSIKQNITQFLPKGSGGEENDENSGQSYGEKGKCEELETEQQLLKQNENYQDKIYNNDQSDKTLQYMLDAEEKNNNNVNNSDEEEEEMIFQTNDEKVAPNNQISQPVINFNEENNKSSQQNDINQNIINEDIDKFKNDEGLMKNENYSQQQQQQTLDNNININENQEQQTIDNNNINMNDNQQQINVNKIDGDLLEQKQNNNEQQQQQYKISQDLNTTPLKSTIINSQLGENLNIIKNVSQPASSQKQKYIYAKKKKIKKFIDTDCSVCFSNIITDYNPVVYCSMCSISFHKYCYGIIDIPKGRFLCDKCEFLNSIKKRDREKMEQEAQCKICYVEELPLKQMCQKEFYHPACLFLQNFAFIQAGKVTLRNEIKNSMQTLQLNSFEQWLNQSQKLEHLEKECKLCGKLPGHKQKCIDPLCNNYFHILCAYLDGEKVNIEDSYEKDKDFCHFIVKIQCSDHIQDSQKYKQLYYRRFAINYENICQYENFELFMNNKQLSI